MKEPTFDGDGYPTEETLEVIRKWGDDFEGLMQFVKRAWKHSDVYFETLENGIGYEFKNKIYHLHTVGWSGNESIIGALQDNMMFWALCWQESKRGGHYKFSV